DGVTGTFTLEEFQLRLGAGSPTSGPYCPNTQLGGTAGPQVSDVIAVTSKSLSGTGMSTAVWEYDYVDNGNEIITTVIRPDNTKEAVYYPTPYDWATPRAHSNMTRREIFPTPSAGTPNDVVTYTYLQESSAGSSIILNVVQDAYRPVRSKLTTLTRGTDWYKTEQSYVTNRSSST